MRRWPTGWVAGVLTGVCLAGVLGVAVAEDHIPRVLSRGTTPPGLQAIIAAAGGRAAHPAADQLLVFDSTRVVVEDSGLTHRYRHTLRKVLTAAGGRDLSAERFDYDPASNMIEIRRVRIHHADGTYSELDPSRAVDVAAPAHGIYWGARMRVLGLPRPAPGDAIEIHTYKKGFLIAYLCELTEDEERFIPPMRGHFYDSVLFSGGTPIGTKHYRLIVPREKLVQYTVYNGEVFSALAYTDTTLVYDWWLCDQPAVTHEARQVSTSDFVPKVVMATVGDWPEKSRWFCEINEPVFAGNEAIQQKVAELIAGLDTDEERFAALTHWVADNIRYSGLSMGPGEGYTLHPSRMTWADRCGVCKDIAGMLITFLRAAGYTTYPAMTMAGARVERVPADQFNHCVVAVELADGSFRMLDPTWVGHYRDLWSKAEGEQHYVVGTPRGEDLAAIRAFAADESPLSVTLRTRLDEAGTLAGEIELVGEGYMDGRLRGVLARRARPAWEEFVGQLLRPIASAMTIERAEFGDVADYGRPLRIRATFRAPGYAAVTDSTIDFRVPSLRFLDGAERFVRIVNLPHVEDRRHAALFWATGVIDACEELTLPAHYRFAGDLPHCTLTHAAATLAVTAEVQGRRLELRERLSLEKRTVPAAEWADLAAVADSVSALAERFVHGTR